MLWILNKDKIINLDVCTVNESLNILISTSPKTYFLSTKTHPYFISNSLFVTPTKGSNPAGLL